MQTPTTQSPLVLGLIEHLQNKMESFRAMSQAAHENLKKNILIRWDAEAGDIFEYEFFAHNLEQLLTELREEPGREAEILQQTINSTAQQLIQNTHKKAGNLLQAAANEMRVEVLSRMHRQLVALHKEFLKGPESSLHQGRVSYSTWCSK